MQRDSLGPDHPDALRTVSQLAFTIYLCGRTKEAAETIRPNVMSHTRVHGRDHPLTLDSQRFLAHMLWVCGELEESEELARDLLARARAALGDGHRTTVWARHTAALVAQHRGRLDEADAALREVAAAAAQALPSNPVAALACTMRAIGLTELGRCDEAESQITPAIEWATRRFGERHPFLLHLRCVETLIVRGRGDLAGAETLREIAEVQRQLLGPRHFMTMFTEAQLIEVLLDLDRPAEAEERARSLPEAERAISGTGGTSWLRARYLYGRTVLECGRTEDAERLLGEVIRDAERLVPGGFLEMPEIRAVYGRCLTELSRLGEARSQLERAYDPMAEMRGVQHAKVRACAEALAKVFEASGDIDKAAEWRAKNGR